MTEKELRKLNRYQLLDLLVVQTRRADELQEKLEELEHKYNQQKLHLSSLGSIAEASLHLSGIFDAAQNAADRYLNAAKQQADGIVDEAQQKAAAMIRSAEAQIRCMAILQDQNHSDQ